MALPAQLQNLTTTYLQLTASPREGFVFEGEGILIPPGPGFFEVAPETYALLESEIIDLSERGFLVIISTPADSRASIQQLLSDVLIVPRDVFKVSGSASFFLGKL